MVASLVGFMLANPSTIMFLGGFANVFA